MASVFRPPKHQGTKSHQKAKEPDTHWWILVLWWQKDNSRMEQKL